MSAIDRNRRFYTDVPHGRVTCNYGSVTVVVPGELDHPQTRRARARKAVREALGPEWDVLDYRGWIARKPWGSWHTYGAVRIA